MIKNLGSIIVPIITPEQRRTRLRIKSNLKLVDNDYYVLAYDLKNSSNTEDDNISKYLNSKYPGISDEDIIKVKAVLNELNN